ncbi:tetraacyldisaccharide 4'-kinase [Stenotrophomonas koreensis]|uniref:tetraacyldisaccharide 4'-kinase n=1 Tax=Stenotrophomonas koreensis TaxID=266128 RepID=UPI00339813A7
MGRQTPEYWYQDGVPVPLWAAALAPLYEAVVHLRGSLYRRGGLSRHSLPVPVLVVGNITAGGTGKTPLTIAVVERLLRAGWKPGVASRGYGRQQAKTARWVDAATPATVGGDEPVLIARKTGVPVRVDVDRVAAARALVQAGCDVIISDDGLQHYRLARDIEVEVVDAQRRYGNGRMIPAGPLREPVGRAAQCDFRIVNLGVDGRAQDVGFGQWPMRLDITQAVPLAGGRERALSSFEGQRVHAVAGIAHPERFFQMLRQRQIAVVPHAFADHHQFSPADFDFGSRLPVLMTEKDAVKCAAFAQPGQFSVPLQAELPEALWISLLDRLEQLRPR